MSTMLKEVYDAFKEASASEEKGQVRQPSLWPPTSLTVVTWPPKRTLRSLRKILQAFAPNCAPLARSS